MIVYLERKKSFTDTILQYRNMRSRHISIIAVAVFITSIILIARYKHLEQTEVFHTLYSSTIKKESVSDKVTLYTESQALDELLMYLKPPHVTQPVVNKDTKYSQAHQDKVVYDIFPTESGFFIEMGAYNGIQLSNTLWLERKHNWTGLLIEANPSLCKEIDRIKRNVWRLCACISTSKQVTFIPGRVLGAVKETINTHHMNAITKTKEIKVPCFTLARVLTKINVYKINYFSLDVEGAELYILDTIKYLLLTEKLIVLIWTIEYRVFDGRKNIVHKSKETLDKIRQYFNEIGGYFEHSQLSEGPLTQNLTDGHALDVVFVHIKSWCKYKTLTANTTDYIKLCTLKRSN